MRSVLHVRVFSKIHSHDVAFARERPNQSNRFVPAETARSGVPVAETEKDRGRRCLSSDKHSQSALHRVVPPIAASNDVPGPEDPRRQAMQSPRFFC